MAAKKSHKPQSVPQVMVSSTRTALANHRDALIKAIMGHQLFPNVMENDPPKPEDVIDSSLKMVQQSVACFSIIGCTYGQIPECPTRNPNNLSISELEFDEAIKQNLPIYLFIMGEDH